MLPGAGTVVARIGIRYVVGPDRWATAASRQSLGMTPTTTRPPYTATDYAAALTAFLVALCDALALFAPQAMPFDKATRDVAIQMLSALLGTIIVAFLGHRAIKHAAHVYVASLKSADPAVRSREVPPAAARS